MIHNFEALIYGCVNNCIIITIILIFTVDNVWLAANDEQASMWRVP